MLPLKSEVFKTKLLLNWICFSLRINKDPKGFLVRRIVESLDMGKNIDQTQFIRHYQVASNGNITLK